MDNIFRQKFILQNVSEKGEFEVDIVTLGERNSNGIIWDPNVQLISSQVDISPYNHSLIVESGVLPAGAGVVSKRGNMLVLQGHFNLDTVEGDAAYKRSAFKQNHGYRDEWSIAAIPHDGNMVDYQGKQTPNLTVAETLEASSVIAGADKNAVLKVIQSKIIQTNENDGNARRYMWLPGIERKLHG